LIFDPWLVINKKSPFWGTNGLSTAGRKIRGLESVRSGRPTATKRLLHFAFVGVENFQPLRFLKKKVVFM